MDVKFGTSRTELYLILWLYRQTILRLYPAGTLYLTLSYADLPEAYCRAKFAAAGVHQASKVSLSEIYNKQWKKEQVSHCCTADFCPRQSVNQLYNNQKMDKLVLFSIACFCTLVTPDQDTLNYTGRPDRGSKSSPDNCSKCPVCCNSTSHPPALAVGS